MPTVAVEKSERVVTIEDNGAFLYNKERRWWWSWGIKPLPRMVQLASTRDAFHYKQDYIALLLLFLVLDGRRQLYWEESDLSWPGTGEPLRNKIKIHEFLIFIYNA